MGQGVTKHNKIIDPVLPNGTFLQNPGLEPSDLVISCLQTVPKAKMEELANLGASSLIRGSLFRDTSLEERAETGSLLAGHSTMVASGG